MTRSGFPQREVWRDYWDSLEKVHAYLTKIKDTRLRAQTAKDLGVVYPAPTVTTVKPSRRKHTAPPAPVLQSPTLADDQALHLHLPYPPSVNSIWRAVVVWIGSEPRARVRLSEQGRAYRREVLERVSQRGRVPLNRELVVALHLTPPDRRRRDIDNPVKACLDALTHAGIWADDSLIVEMHVYRYPPQPRAGRAEVVIRPHRTGPELGNPGDELALDYGRRGLL